jgi:Tfp pilus assembly protein PilO
MTATPKPQSIAWLGVLLLILSVFAIYWMQAPSLVQNIAYLATEEAVLAGKQRDLTQLKQAAQTLQTKEDDLASRGVTLGTLSSIIPPTEDVPGLYLLMEAIVAEAKVSDVEYQIGRPTTEDGGVRIPLTITAKGESPALKEFMQSLHLATRPISFTSVSIAPASETESGAVYSFSGTGYVRAGSVSDAYTTESLQP